MQSTPILQLSYKAAADFRTATKRYHFCRFTADHTVDVAGAAAEDVIGVIQDEPDAAGKFAAVRHLGTTEIKAGAAFAAGIPLMPDSTGRAVTATTGKAYFAVAAQAATAAGDIVEAVMQTGRVP